MNTLHFINMFSFAYFNPLIYHERLTIFAKSLHHRSLTVFKIRFWNVFTEQNNSPFQTNRILVVSPCPVLGARIYWNSNLSEFHPFYISDLPGLRWSQYVENLQDYAQSMLGEYVRTAHPQNPARFGKLLLLLPSLRSVRSSAIQNLFLKDGIEQPQMIDKMLNEMFKGVWYWYYLVTLFDCFKVFLILQVLFFLDIHLNFFIFIFLCRNVVNYIDIL